MGEVLTYCIPCDFDLRGKTKPLRALETEADILGAAVQVYYLVVQGEAFANGNVKLRVTKYAKLTRPLPKAKRMKAEADAPAEEASGADVTDSAEDIGEGTVSSDLRESSVIVATGKEDSPSSSWGSDSSDVIKKPLKPVLGPGGDEPATGGPATGGDEAPASSV